MEEYIIESNIQEASLVDTDVIPDTCLSFTEMNDHISIFAEDELNNIIESIGLSELEFFKENTSNILYEAEQLEVLQEAFMNHITKVWGSLKTFWARVIISMNDKNGALAKSFAQADLSKLSDSNMYGATYSYANLNKTNYAAKADNMAKATSKVFNALIYNGASKEEVKTATDKLLNDVSNTILGLDLDSKNAKVAKKTIKANLKGSKVTANKAWVIKNKSYISNVLTRTDDVKYAKKAYNEEKKAITKMEKELKSLSDSLSSIAQSWGRVLNTIISTMNLGYSAEIDVLNRRYSEYKLIAYKVIKACK